MKFLLLFIFPLYLFGDIITFGVIPRYSHEQTMKKFKPFVDAIEKQTNLEVKLVTTNNVSSFKRKIAVGVFDMAYANPLHYIAVNKLEGYQAIVKEDINLHGVIIVKNDSKIKSVEELKGKVVSFPAPSAYAATKMTRVGIFDKFKYDITDNAKYVGTLHNVMKSVTKGDSEAGGVALEVYERSEGLNKDLKIIYTTKEGSSHPIFIHPRIKYLEKQISKALLSMSKEDLKGSAFESIIKTSNSQYVDTEELMQKDLKVK